MFKKNQFFILAILSFYSLFCYSQNVELKKQKLKHLQTQIEENEIYIKSVNEQKEKANKNKSNYQKRLQTSASSLKKLYKQDKQIQNQILKAQKELTKIETSENETRNNCISLYQTLYLIDNNIGTSSEIDRVLMAELLKDKLSQLNEIQKSKESVVNENFKRNKSYKDLQTIKTTFSKKNQRYKNKISAIDKELVSLDKRKFNYQETLDLLEIEANSLLKLLDNLQKANIHDNFTYEFSTEKLDWPVDGRIIKNYGSHKFEEDEKLKIWNNGIDFSVSEKSEVRAIDNGVVAFASWFQSWGKIVIIDHQNGYQSLYTNNYNLLVSKGDSINKNQVIAQSGINQKNNLEMIHFELRKRGRPIDPNPFFKK